MRGPLKQVDPAAGATDPGSPLGITFDALREGRAAPSWKERDIRFQLNGVPSVISEARGDGDWLTLVTRAMRSEAPGGAKSPPPTTDVPALAMANAALPGGAKFAISGREGTPILLSEIPLEECRDLRVRILEALEAQRAGLPWLLGKPMPLFASSEDGPGSSPVPPDLLQDLCRSAGWPFEERSGGRISCALEGTSHHSAILESPEPGAVRISADLASREGEPPPAARDALARFLLASSGSVRLARAAILERPGGILARLEVRFESPPSPEELGCALSACSIGCDLLAQEAKILLEDLDVARAYLAIREPFREPWPQSTASSRACKETRKEAR